MRVSDLRKETKNITVQLQGVNGAVPLEVEYRWYGVDLALIDALKEVEGIDKRITEIEHLVVSWDLQFDDGSMVPITRDGIKEAGLQTWHILSILDAIYIDQYGKPEEKKG